MIDADDTTYTCRWSDYEDTYDADDESELLWAADPEEELLADQSCALALDAKDSLTILQNLSDSSLPPMSREDIIDSVQHLLQALAEGRLPPQQAHRIACLAQQLLNSSSLPERCASPEPPRDDSPSLAGVADRIARQACSDVERNLIVSERDDLNATTGEDLSKIAGFIVERSINNALYSLQAITNDTDRRPFSAPQAGDKQKPDTRRQQSAVDGTRRVASSTSDFIQSVLEMVATEMHKEIENRPSRSSTTSLLVTQALDQAVRDLRHSSSWQGPSPLNWDVSVDMKASSESVTGQFVRDTISRVVEDIQHDPSLALQWRDSDQQSACSLFAEALVEDAVQQCLQDLASKTMPEIDVVDLATSIILSCQELSTRGSKPDNTEQRKSSTDLIDALIRQTLNRVREDIETEQMNNLEVLRMARQLDVTEALGVSDSMPHSSTSNIADALVEQALKQSLSEDTSRQATQMLTDALTEATGEAARGGPSAASVIAETYVTKALEDAMPLPNTASKSDASLLAEKAIHLAMEEAIDDILQRDTPMTSSVTPQNEPGDNVTSGVEPVERSSVTSQVSLLAASCVKQAISGILASEDTFILDGSVISKESPSASDINTLVDSIIKDAENSDLVTQLSHEKTEKAQNPEAPAQSVAPTTSLHDHEHEHIVFEGHDHDSSSGSEANVEITPTCHGKPLPIDHHIVEDCLSILSVRKDADLGHPEEPTARMSFRDLIHPDISRVKRLNIGKDDQICEQIMSLSKHHISLSHLMDEEPKPHDVPTSFSAPQPMLPIEESDDSGLSESENEEKVTTTLHSVRSYEDVHQTPGETKPKDDGKQRKQTVKSKESKKDTSKKSKVPQTKPSPTKASPSTSSSKTSSKSPAKTPSPYSVSQARIKKDNPRGASSAPQNPSCPKVDIPQTSASLRNPVKDKARACSGTNHEELHATTATSHIEKLTAQDKKPASSENVSKDEQHDDMTTAERRANSSQSVAGIENSPSKTNTGESPGEKSKEPQDSDTDVVNKSPSAISKATPVKPVTPDQAAVLQCDRDSPVAEIVEEEDIPTPRRRSMGHVKSDANVADGSTDKRKYITLSTSSTTKAKLTRKVTSTHSEAKPAPSTSKTLSAIYGKGRKTSIRSTSKTNTHQSLNLTPRPSSGYRKSPTPQIVSPTSSTQSSTVVKQRVTPNKTNIATSEEASERKRRTSEESRCSATDSVGSAPRSIPLTPKSSRSSLLSLTAVDAPSQRRSSTQCTHSDNEPTHSSHTLHPHTSSQHCHSDEQAGHRRASHQSKHRSHRSSAVMPLGPRVSQKPQSLGQSQTQVTIATL